MLKHRLYFGFLTMLLAFLLLGGITAVRAQESDASNVSPADSAKQAQREAAARKKAEKNKKKLRVQADNQFRLREMVLAARSYTLLLNIEPDNYHAAYRLGRCHWYMNNLDSAQIAYEKAIQIDPSKNDTIYFDLGICLKKMAKYTEAKRYFNDFNRRYTQNDYLKRQTQVEIAGCDEAIKMMKIPPRFQVTCVPALSQEGSDYEPTIWYTQTDSFIIFTSHRHGNRGKDKYLFTGENFSDLWWAEMTDDSTYGQPQNLGKKVNTKVNDGGAVIDAATNTMYYTICGNGKRRKFFGCSIYQSTFDPNSKKWSKFRKVEGLNGERKTRINSRGKLKVVPTYDAQPTLADDGQTMYFVSDREGGEGETDIWYSQKAGTLWSTPVNCGKIVNTEFSEIAPCYVQNKATLYFASNGHKGMGGYDLFEAEGKLNTWDVVENLGYPINTSYNEYSISWIRPDTSALISSNRPGCSGRDDIFRIQRLKKPPIKVTVHGRVRDKETFQAIPFAVVTLYKIHGSHITPIDTFKTTQNAYYEFQLEQETDYKVVANAPEYLSDEKAFTTKGLTESKDLEQDIDIYLQRIVLDRPIVLQNVYYDFDKYNLRPESIVELDRLIKILNANPQIVIQIGSHTDTNGPEEYNIELSKNRARSVVEYLTRNGINAKRLSWFGFGESQPLIYPELSDADEQSNRRTEFRIRSVDFSAK